MKRSQFSEQQSAFIVCQAEAGTRVEEVCRKAGISQQTYDRWRKRYGGLMPSEMKRLRQLEEEHLRLTRLATDLSLDKEMLQEVGATNALRPAERRELVDAVRTRWQGSIRRACTVLKAGRSTDHSRSRRVSQVVLKKRIREIAETRVRSGYRRIHGLLRREGRAVNVKRV